MARHNLLDTDTVALNDIFTNGKRYQVPVYQRDYSWKEENWDDLWEDILSIYKQETRVHYMGAIVLQDLKEKQYSIIDGQQRLATFSIIALAIIRRIQDLIDLNIDVEENKERKELYMEQFIGSKDGVSLRYSNKLKLNENNDSFYRSFLVQLRDPINPHKLPSSNKLLQKAFEYFYKQIKELFGENPKGNELADFLQNQLAEKLLFIQIVVENDLDAYTVFETLNARGIELSISDLLKNYLLSLTAQSDEDKLQAKEQWNRIIQITDLDKFPTFLRYFWHSRYETVRKEQLFKALRKSVTNKEETFELLDNLEKYAAVYAALKNPNDDLWQGNKEIRNRINELKLFGVTQPYPLLLEAYFKLNSEFEDILKFCSIIAFRYNIIGGLDPKKQEQVFHITAKKTFNGEITKASQVAQELRSIYLNDEAFVNSFSTKQINTKGKKKLARFILFSLENQIAGTDRHFEDETATIEHILPENPTLDWEQYFPLGEQENYIYRLGNLTLLESSKNNNCGTKPFLDKQEIYKLSQYKMTEQIDYPEWTANQVRSRQENLAKTAKTVWKISQLSN
ncbi:MAG TPA: DUF262 domain-containing HNH endonuclease family protein [Pyrinomonadaceae bacterium]|nr:DUF262 domain-containing HNH endonuclease family protein [Pyrinomonadaceae bacterium]